MALIMNDSHDGPGATDSGAWALKVCRCLSIMQHRLGGRFCAPLQSHNVGRLCPRGKG